MVRFIEEHVGAHCGDPFLHVLGAASSRLARHHDDLSPTEHLVNLGDVLRNVEERRDDRMPGAGGEQSAIGMSQNSERRELVRRLLAKRVTRYDNQESFASHGQEHRDHGVRLAGARRHDDGANVARYRPVCVNAMQSADLRRSKAEHTVRTVFGHI